MLSSRDRGCWEGFLSREKWHNDPCLLNKSTLMVLSNFSARLYSLGGHSLKQKCFICQAPAKGLRSSFVCCLSVLIELNFLGFSSDSDFQGRDLGQDSAPRASHYKMGQNWVIPFSPHQSQPHPESGVSWKIGIGAKSSFLGALQQDWWLRIVLWSWLWLGFSCWASHHFLVPAQVCFPALVCIYVLIVSWSWDLKI